MAKENRDVYYMEIARVVASRGDCLGTNVGTVIVVGDRIVSTGFNGAPDGITHCSDGGCERCRSKSEGMIKSGEDLDKCICVHAEENAILSAARHGIRLSGCDIYTTIQPCLGCIRQIIQVKAARVIFSHQYPMSHNTMTAYDRLCAESQLKVTTVQGIPDIGKVLLEDTLETFQ